MAELTEIFTLPEKLYSEGCPVYIKSGVLLRDEETESLSAKLIIQNINPEKIISLSVDLHIFDRANNEIEVIRDHTYSGINAERDELIGEDELINIITTKGTSFSVAVKRIGYDDEQFFTGSASLLYQCITADQTLEESYESKELEEQYSREFCEELAKSDAHPAHYVPFFYKDLWGCACGAVNHISEDKCHLCSASLDAQTDLFDNKVKIVADLEAHKKALAEKAEQERLEAERKAAEAAAAKAEAERLAAEEKARQEAKARRRKRAIKLSLAIGIPLAIAIVIFLIVLFTWIMPSARYASADNLLKSGDYSSAVTAFEELGPFSDSRNKAEEAKFLLASSMVESKDYDGAIALLDEIKDYEGAGDKRNEAIFLKAKALVDSKDYDGAISLLDSIADYEGAAELSSQCYFEKASAALERDDFDSASEFLSKTSGTWSEQLQEKFCDKGIELYKTKNEEEAAKYLELITDEEQLKKVDAAYYERAKSLFDEKDYAAAGELFTELGDYEDSASWLQEIDYAQGEDAFTAGNFEEAKSFYTAVGDYKDSADKLKQCDYGIARNTMNSGDYQKAIELFTALDGYSDSATQIQECTYQLGMQQYNNGQYVDSYNTLIAISDYSPAYIQLITKSEYYIYVYDAGLGTNPQH